MAVDSALVDPTVFVTNGMLHVVICLAWTNFLLSSSTVIRSPP